MRWNVIVLRNGVRTLFHDFSPGTFFAHTLDHLPPFRVTSFRTRTDEELQTCRSSLFYGCIFSSSSSPRPVIPAILLIFRYILVISLFF